MNRKIKKPILLLVLACVLACSLIFAACDDDNKLSGLGGSDTAAYTVTVTKGENVDVDFTSITAQWKSGSEVKASIVLDAAGKAAVTLAKGNYTVSLSGNALADYDWSEQSVSEASPNATITLSAKAPASPEAITYTVTVTCNDSELDLTTLAVQWAGNNDTQSRVLKADGTASISLDPGDYAVSVVGLTKPAYYTVTTDTVSATKTAANISITAVKRDVAVTVTSPVDLPADVKVQVKDDGEPYGEPVEISENKATAVVPFGKAVTIELVGIDAYDYIESSPVNVAAADKTAALTVSLSTVTYTVNVVSEAYSNIDALTVSICKDGDPVANASNLPLTGGVATAALLAGDYTVVLNGLDAANYKYKADTLTMVDHTATVTISSTSLTLSRVEGGDNIVTYDATTFFGREDEVIKVTIPSDGVQVGKFYSISLSSESDLFNSFNFNIVYNGQTFTIGKEQLEAGKDSIAIISIAENKYEFTVSIKDGGFFEDEFIISLQEYEKIDNKIELDVEKEIFVTATYEFTAPTNDAYLITIDVGNLGSKDYQISMGEGPIFGDGSNRSKETTYEFFAVANEPFEFSAYLYKTGTIKLTVTKVYGDIVLDQPTKVTLGTYSQAIKSTFKVPYKGIYKLEITSGNVIAKQIIVSVEGKNPIINDEKTSLSPEFSAEIGDSYINFTNFAGAELIGVEITFVVTLVKDVGNLLPVGGQNTANIGGHETPGKLVLENAEAGKTYRLLVEWQAPFNKINVITLKYCEQEYEVRLVGDEESKYYNHYSVDFEYVDGENNIEIFTPGTLVKNVVVKLEEVKDEAAGPQVGDTVMVTPGDSESSAAVIAFDLDFIEGMKYTVSLDASELGMANNWKFVVTYNGTKIADNVEGSALTFSFTAVSGGDLKVYCTEHKDMFGRDAALFAMPFKITNIEEGEETPSGLTVGGSYVLAAADVGDTYPTMPAMMGGTAIPLVGLTEGTKYTITIQPGAVGDFNKTFYYNDDDLSSSTKTQIRNFSFTFTFTKGMAIRILVPGGKDTLAADLTLTLEAA